MKFSVNHHVSSLLNHVHLSVEAGNHLMIVIFFVVKSHHPNIDWLIFPSFRFSLLYISTESVPNFCLKESIQNCNSWFRKEMLIYKPLLSSSRQAEDLRHYQGRKSGWASPPDKGDLGGLKTLSREKKVLKILIFL